MNAKEFLESMNVINDPITVNLMEAYHRARVEGVTAEDIEDESETLTDETAYGFRRGCRWLIDKLLNQ